MVRVHLAALAGSLVLLVSCGGSEPGAPAKPKPVDERRGSYQGVGLADTPAEVETVFGKAPPWNGNEPVTPLARLDTDAPWTFRCSPPGRKEVGTTVLRYEFVSFTVDRGQICNVEIIDEAAVTRRGVAVGDPLEEAKRAYPGSACGTTEHGEGGKFDACHGQTAPGVSVWFGGDPITTIDLNRYGFGRQFIGQSVSGIPPQISLRP